MLLAVIIVSDQCFQIHVDVRMTRKENPWLLPITTLGVTAAIGLHFYSRRTKRVKPSDCIYLDYNATTPIHPCVLEAMIPFLTSNFGNPSSNHAFGDAPKVAISNARRAILSLLSSALSKDPHEESRIIFTGCGSESDNLAIYLAIHSSPNVKRKHIVTSNVEHPAVLETLRALEEKGEVDVTYVPVNTLGYVSAQDIISAIKDETVLVTLMLANNETGALQPVREVAQFCRQHDVLFHTDAAQAVGKVSISIEPPVSGEIGGIDDCDMITIVGHKFGAPKGIACLYIRPGCLSAKGRCIPTSWLLGGGQEYGRRAGTENVPYIVGMGAAAALLTKQKSSASKYQWEINAERMEEMRSRLFKKLQEELGEDMIHENGPSDAKFRLPNTLSIGLKYVNSGDLLSRIRNQVACSAGSACHSKGGSISSILLAMKVPQEFASGTLRLSIGPNTTALDVDTAALIISSEVKKMTNEKIKN